MTDLEERVTLPENLRDLSSQAFQARYACDRFTSTVLSSRFRYVLDHVCAQLLRNSFSPVLRDYYDFSAVVSGPAELGYCVPSVAQSVSVFFGSMREAVASSIEEFGVGNLRPGDVIVSNDPFRAGTHVNDVCFIRPVFHDGQIVSYVTIRAHMLDMGGVIPGGFSGLERNVYETGITIPPMLLYRDNEAYEPTLNLILDNVRFGAIIYPDIETIASALQLGEDLLLESVGRYGLEAFHGAMRYSCDASAESMRAAIAALPDGDYTGEDHIDCDGVDDTLAYRVQALVRKRGSMIEIDLSGTSQQARSSINSAWPDVKSAVVIAVKFLLDPRSIYTSGTMRPIDVVIPMGTVASAIPPDGPVFLYWEPLKAVIHSVMVALNAALGDRAIAGDSAATMQHSASGFRADGTPWVEVGLCGGQQGGWGATADGDADSGQAAYLANMIDPPIESIEADTPVMVMRKEYATDSGGAGHYRGGAAMIKDSLWLTDTVSHCLATHGRSASGFGAAGGGAGTLAAVWAFDPAAIEALSGSAVLPTSPEAYRASLPITGVFDPETKAVDLAGQYLYWARESSGWRLPANSVWRYLTNGGGGWGDPLTREAEAVLRDVRDGYVSIAGAAEDYGVVIEGDPIRHPEDLTVNAEATHQLRSDHKADENWQRRHAPVTPQYPAIAAPLHVHREPAPGTCASCGANDMARYPVLGEMGWQDVVRCQRCLHTAESHPSPAADLIPMSHVARGLH